MFSFKERLVTFKHWPNERSDFVQKLAIMGHFSKPNSLHTCCYYCHTEHSTWDFNENPLMAHLASNSACPIFKLFNKSARRALTIGHSHYKKSNSEIENLIENNFVKLNIDDSNSFYCLKCGSNDLKHKCFYLKIQKITENMDFTNSQFYIKYLNGDFVDQINRSLENNFELSENQRETINEISQYNRGEPFESLENFLKNCSELIYDDIEKRMKKIEKDAFDSMYNETMII